MSENDPRFGYPIEFVKEHILGCFEASKACALLPGKPHLYHVEFLKREDSTIKDGSAIPLDFYLQAHFSPCEEVSWYLHTRENLPVYEGSTEVDEEFVEANSEGVIEGGEADAFEPQVEVWSARIIPELTEKEKATYIFDAMQAHSTRIQSLITNMASAPTTPENSKDIVTDTFGCRACVQGNWDQTIQNHSRACKARRSRFDKINKELNK